MVWSGVSLLAIPEHGTPKAQPWPLHLRELPNGEHPKPNLGLPI